MEINKIINNINDTLKKEEIKRNHNLYEFQRKKLYNILGEELVNIFKETKVIVAGGSINSIFTNREINDIDVYFRDDISLANVIDYIWEDYGILCATNKAVLLRCDSDENKLVQLISYKKYKDAKDIFNSFDFICCMGAFDFKTETFIFDERFFMDNSQNILRFNSNTDYPLMSMIRVDKYKHKGYSISKSEFIRILLTCMNKKINTLDELKEQVGGMYGLDLTKLYEGVKTKEDGTIDLIQVVDSLKDLYLEDDYFKDSKNIKVKLNSKWELINKCIQNKINMNYIEQDGNNYMIEFNGNLKCIDLEDEKYKNVNFTKMSIDNFIKEKIYYKWVKKDGETLRSFAMNDFIYEVGKTAIAKKGYINECYHDGRLYVCEKDEILNNCYSNRNDKVMIELIPKKANIDTSDRYIGDIIKLHITEAHVNRIVPEEEYEKWNNVN